MGLFDKMLKEGSKAIKELASEENKEKASKLLDKVVSTVEETAKEVTSEENKEKAKGFFDKVVSSVEGTARDLASDENKEKASKFFSSIKGDIKGFSEKLEQEAAEKEKLERYLVPDESDKTCREKILEVLAEEFPQYTVIEDLSPTAIGGTGRFMNYSIAVYDNLTPKLVIMIIGKTTTAHREYRWSREEAERKGITFLNFVAHYPNNREYISDRLHKYL